MPELQHEVGDLVTVEATWKVNNALTDPGTVILRTRDPAGTIASYTYGISSNVGKAAVGSYFGTFTVATAGRWYYRWEGTTPAAGVVEGQIVVTPSPFSAVALTRALTTVEDLKAYVNAPDPSDDLELSRLIVAASEAIMMESGREFAVLGTNPQTRKFFVNEHEARSGEIHIGDWAAVTGVTLQYTTGATAYTFLASDYAALPFAPRDAWEPITRLRFYFSPPAPGWIMAVTGNAGFPAVPETVRQWTIETVRHWFDRDLESFSETITDAGQIVRPRSLPMGVLMGIRQFHELSIS